MTEFAPHINVLFSVLGQPATYTPEGGTPLSIRMITRCPDEIENLGGAQVIVGTTLFDIQKSDVPHPKKGDELTLDGVTYIVLSEPVSRDPDRLIWTLSVTEDSE
jgi:hypothetical protein